MTDAGIVAMLRAALEARRPARDYMTIEERAYHHIEEGGKLSIAILEAVHELESRRPEPGEAQLSPLQPVPSMTHLASPDSVRNERKE